MKCVSSRKKPALRNPSRKRGPVEVLLREIARKGGYSVVNVSSAKMAALKGASRARDQGMIDSGQVTPEQIQSQNDMFPGEIAVLDWSPIFT